MKGLVSCVNLMSKCDVLLVCDSQLCLRGFLEKLTQLRKSAREYPTGIEPPVVIRTNGGGGVAGPHS